MKQDFENKNHKTKANFHKINLEKFEKLYRDFFASEINKNLELNLCKDYEKIDYESLRLYEQFLGE